MKPFEMTEEFHRTFDSRQPQKPTPFTQQEALNRAGFKVEELVEFLYAASQGNTESFQQATDQLHEAIEKARTKVLSKQTEEVDSLVDQVDALTDLLYFTYGSFSLLGVDPEPIMAIVHQANMGKLFPDGQPHYDPVTNKVLKPDNWAQDFAPESKIKAELQKQSQQSL